MFIKRPAAYLANHRSAIWLRGLFRLRPPTVVPLLAAALSAGGLLLGGCGLDFTYLIPAGLGQIDVLLNAVPISRAIESGRLTEEQVGKLELILDARAYARDVMGLHVDVSYTTFYDAGSDPVAFNVSASRKDAFEPVLWRFPIVGTFPYLGFFDRELSDAKVDQLTAAGMDVFVYEIDAYSGLEFFPSPVLSPMLERSEINLAETVFHELLHSTIWRANDTSFNESLATFYGRTGAVGYFTDRHPHEPERVQRALDRFEDVDRYSDFILTLYNELDAFYCSGLSTMEKISGREAIYQAGRDRFVAEVQPAMHRPESFEWVRNMPANNARLLGVRRYNLDLEVFEQVFAATGEDWLKARDLFRSAANASEPYAYLRAWLESLDGG